LSAQPHIRALRWLLLAALPLLCAGAARGEHFSGASITYDCLGGNMYTVYLDLYLDCSGSPITGQTLYFTNSCGVQFTQANLQPVLVEEVSPLCNNSLANSTCNGGPLPGFRRYRFQTTLFLSPCNFWTIYWNICCRNTMQNVGGTPGIYVQATLNNAGGLCDDSPTFADSGIPYVCVGTSHMYSPGVTEPDGNTMVFSLINARFLAPPPTSVTYINGFTGANPLPGMTIDPNSGQLTFSPNVQGNYVVVIQVATYDGNGQLIGTVMRDLMFVAVACDGVPPISQGLSNAVNAIVTGMNSLEVCPGQNFCVDLVFEDPDPGNVITMVSNAAAEMPGSTFTVSGTSPAVATICWMPNPALMPVNLFVEVQDGQCPIQNTSSTSIQITEALPLAVPPNAGTNGSATSCPNGPAVPLFPLLGGTPQTGGFWSDPNGQSHSGSFVPGTDPFGAYTYLVGNACENATAVVTITQSGGASPGTNGNLSICSTAAPVQLINSLGGTPAAGGTWTGPAGAMNGTYDPAVHAGGVYTYTLPTVGGCPGGSATVTVMEMPAPNPGVSTAITLCSSSPITNLFTLLGNGAQAGGTWTGPSAITGNYNPFLHNPGVYTYTVIGAAPCANASATVTVTENQAANAGTNTNITICSTNAPVDLFTSLNGNPQPGGAWSGPAGAMNGIFDPAVHPPGFYSYTVTGIAPCANATSFVSVTVNTAPNAGTNAAATVCAGGAAVNLFGLLGGTPQAGGTWSGPSAITGSFDPQLHQPGAYVYTVNGQLPCQAATATVTVTVAPTANAGTDAQFTLCSDGPVLDLFASLGPNAQAGGTWAGPSPTTGQYDPQLHQPGAYVYTVAGTGTCPGASATVTIAENAAPNAGTMGSISLCTNEPAVDLFTQLNGTPQPGGTWTGPSAITGMFDPAVHAGGVYIYTVAGTDPCVDASATVTVSLGQSADAGTGTTLSLCSSDPAVDLFAALGPNAQAGGSWNGPSAITGMYDPQLHAPGNYTYTVLGSGGCADASATVTVNEQAQPDAGVDGAIVLCTSAAAVDLFTQLGGTPQAGGTWSGPSAITGLFDPAQHAAGAYVYLVSGNGACADASATVQVGVETAPNAGTNGTVALCTDSAPVDLYTVLGGTPQAGGTWTGPSAISGIFDPALHTGGAYQYAFPATGACPASSAVVTVTLSMAVDAGADATVALCSTAPQLDLFAQLQGTPQGGGTWSGPSATTGLFNPAVHQGGAYVYSITATAPCASSSATVTVSVEVAPVAGVNAATTVCESGAAVDLFALLGNTAQPGGAWSGPSAITGTYDPALHDPGVYTYAFPAGVLCPGSSATVTVVETGIANAGDDATVDLCSSDAPLDLLSLLGGSPDPGGSWTGPSGAVSATFDPATGQDGLYTYTLAAVAPCTGDQATVFIQVNPAANAGADATQVVCANSGAVNLFGSLGGSPSAGGTWTGPGGAFSGMFDPNVDAAGQYTYTIGGMAPCGTASATVTVVVTGAPNAGQDGALSLCSADAPMDLFTQLGGGPDAGGSWTGPGGAFPGVFDPAVHAAGSYTYTITAPPPCGSDVASVIVTVNAAANAGNSTTATVCDSGSPVALLGLLGGTPQPGGSWTGPSGAFSGTFDPATDAAGAYTYTVAGTGSCAAASAVLTVVVTGTPNAGTDGVLSLCSDAAPVDLFTLLGGAPDAGGGWSGAVSPSGIFDPAVHPSGTYTYSIAPAAPCPGDQATVTVSVEQAPFAGTSTALDICPGAGVVDLFVQLGAGAGTGGTWTGPAGAFTGQFDPALHASGSYTYSLGGQLCASASATVDVTVLPGANAGSNGTLSLCASDPVVDLFSALLGTPDVNGSWTGPTGAATSAQLQPSTASSGAYTYTVPGAGNCPAAQAVVQVTISAVPQAGNSGTLDLCTTDGQVSLFDGLSGTLDAGGTWTDPSGAAHGTVIDPLVDVSGTYTYTVTGGSCAPASSTVSILIFQAPDAGGNATAALCTTNPPVVLLTVLQGTPDPGGSWAGPAGASSGIFDPSTSQPGVYTYTVGGNTACGSDNATVTITVSPAANAGTNGAITLCSNDQPVDLFSLLGGTPDATGSWTAPSGTAHSGTFNPASQSGGTYTYTVQPPAPCAAAISTVLVNLLPVPNPQINATNSDACAPVEVTLSHDFTGDASCTWILGNGTVVQDCGPVTTTYEEAGSYTITLLIDANNGCGANTIQEVGLVNVFVKPEAAFEALPEVVGTQAPQVYFHNYSQGASSYLWDMAGTGTHTSEHVNHSFPAELGDEYEVCLISYASPQCADTLCKTITVGDALVVHVPNAFSPDGDGINDLFRPVLDGIDPERYEFMIFDRWGSPLFSTRDINAAWDGNFPSGDAVPQGVYVWKLRLRDAYSVREYDRTGHVTLLR
jgi:gliding motility-associated-like protein